MGSWVNFYGNPAKQLYQPALGEGAPGTAGYGDEVNASIATLGEHDHGDLGGKTLAFATSTAALGAAAPGVAVLPSRGDHVHAHGVVAGDTVHPAYSLLTHLHGADYAPLVHTHGGGSGSDWTINTDATYGDFLSANVTDPGGTGTQVSVREHPSGAVEIVHGNIGLGASNLDTLSPMLNFIQTNTAPDGTPPDMLGNGMITFTSWSAGQRRWGDIGVTFANFPYHRGDANIYAVRVQPTITWWSGSTTMGWRLNQVRHNDSASYVNRSYTRRRLSRLSFAVRPDWGESSDPWPWQMDLDEDGNLWARGDAEFGGHALWLGTNNVDGWSQTGFQTTADDGFGRQIARIRHTILGIMAAPPGNDAGATGAALLFYPWLDPTARGGNSPRGADWPASSKNGAGFIADMFGIAYDHDVRLDETRVTFWPTAGQNGVLLYGTAPNGTATWGAVIAGFTLWKDFAGNVVPYAGLLWSYGAKHVDVRLHGTYDQEATLVIARGDTWGGGNRHGRLVFANTDFGFDYVNGPAYELGQYENVSTVTGVVAGMNLANTHGLALTGALASNIKLIFAIGRRAVNSSYQNFAFGPDTDVSVNGLLMVGGGQIGNVRSNSGFYFYNAFDGHWYKLMRDPANNNAFFNDMGTTMPI